MNDLLYVYKEAENTERWWLAGILTVVVVLLGIILVLAAKGLFMLIPFLGTLFVIFLLGVLPVGGAVWFIIFMVKVVLDSETDALEPRDDGWF